MRILIAFFLAVATAAFPAATKNIADIRLSGKTLSIGLADLLSSKEKALIESGFSTYTLLRLMPAGKADVKSVQPYAVTTCSVKFDTWEEVYDVVTLGAKPKQAQAKDFKEYGDACLTLHVDDPGLVTAMRAHPEAYQVSFFVDQISPEQAAELKDWLVRQQSAFMQGLFSHMLGELKVSDFHEFSLRLAPEAMTRP